MKMSNKFFKLEQDETGTSITMTTRKLHTYMWFSSEEFRELLRFLGPLTETVYPPPLAAQQDGAWRLVETAPHETYVLLGWWDEGKWNCATGFASQGWRRGGVSTMSMHGQATHWRPLPAGPEQKPIS